MYTRLLKAAIAALLAVSSLADAIPEYGGLAFVASGEGASVALVGAGPTNPASFRFSLDGATWENYVIGQRIDIADGDFVCFSASASNPALYGYRFKIKGGVSAHGNVNSMLNSNYSSVTVLPENCYVGLFLNCDSLTSTPDLPATGLSYACYASMFAGCRSITAAPALPATTLANLCYANMFDYCESLASAPTLSATALATSCYANMFGHCSSLETAPALSATTLAPGCYSAMFQGCTLLTTAPALPATTLASYCYKHMFAGCTALESVTLPATAIADDCYVYMLAGCAALRTIKLGYTGAFNRASFDDWCLGIPSSGTFQYLTGRTDFSRGAFAIPNGWTTSGVSSL